MPRVRYRPMYSHIRKIRLAPCNPSKTQRPCQTTTPRVPPALPSPPTPRQSSSSPSSSSSTSPPSRPTIPLGPPPLPPPREADAPRSAFGVFQCLICAHFSNSRTEFLAHFDNATHTALGERRVRLACNGAGLTAPCHLRSKSVERLKDHLQKMDFHYVDEDTPACIVTFGPVGSFIMWDEDGGNGDDDDDDDVEVLDS